MKQVRWLLDIKGVIYTANPDGSPHKNVDGVRRGQVTYLNDADAARYIESRQVTTDLTKEIDQLPLSGPRAGRSPYRDYFMKQGWLAE